MYMQCMSMGVIPMLLACYTYLVLSGGMVERTFSKSTRVLLSSVKIKEKPVLSYCRGFLYVLLEQCCTTLLSNEKSMFYTLDYFDNNYYSAGSGEYHEQAHNK